MDDKCPNCGEAWVDHAECPRCTGTGVTQRTSFKNPKKQLEQDCGVCSGAGRLLNCVEILCSRRDALQAIVDRLLRVLRFPENGYHVCRWCGETITGGGHHGESCGYVALCEEISEARAAAEAAKKGETP